MTTLKNTGAVLLALFAVVALCAGAWFGYWWITRESTSLRAEISRETFEFQQARRDDLTDQITDVAAVDTQIASTNDPDTSAALRAQRTAMVVQACDVASEITGRLPRGTSEFISTECL